jgi:fatty acid desaturase
MQQHRFDRDARSNDQRLRDAMNVGWLRHPYIQGVLTWITTIPHSKQSLRRRARLENLCTAMVALAIGVILCHQAIDADQPWLLKTLLLVLGWGHVLFALRSFRLPNCHACAHGDLTGNPYVDQWVGQTLSAILWMAPMSSYRATHCNDPAHAHHRWTNLLTPGESTFEEIRALGFQPAVPNHENWRHLAALLLSPCFYLHQMRAGFLAAFCSGTTHERAFNYSLWSLILSMLIHGGNLNGFLVTFLVPRLLFESVQVLRSCVEHTFPAPGRRTMASYRSMTSAIIAAEPAPVIHADASQGQIRLQWAQWAIRMLLVHLPTRFWVLTGDVATHDVHHLKPGADFSNFERERMELLQQGYPLTSNWSLLTAIDEFFSSLAIQPPDLFERR